MGPARHPLSLALVALAIGLVMAIGGCGSSGESTGDTAGTTTGASGSTAPVGAAAKACASAGGASDLRVTGIGCAAGRGVVGAWTNSSACSSAAGASRTSCSVDDYRCLGAAAARGLAVSCARPGRSVSFVVKRG